MWTEICAGIVTGIHEGGPLNLAIVPAKLTSQAAELGSA